MTPFDEALSFIAFLFKNASENLSHKEGLPMHNKQNSGARSNYQRQVLDTLGSIQGTIGRAFKDTDANDNKRAVSLFTVLNRVETNLETAAIHRKRFGAVVITTLLILVANAVAMWVMR